MSYAPESSPRPQARPDDLNTNRHESDDNDNDWSTYGTPELYQPKVREALANNETDDSGSKSEQTVFEDILYGGDEPLDPIVDTLPLDERIDLAFDQRLEAGVASTVLGMGTADLVGTVKSFVPGPLKFPVQVGLGTAVSRVTYPPMKEVADYYHGDVLGQPIVDPAPGIFSEENALDFIPGFVSTAAGVGTSALTTTALTALGVTNPIGLAISGVAAGAIGANQAWVWTDEVVLPELHDYVQGKVVESIDLERLTGIPESQSEADYNPPTIAEMEALWDAAAEQYPENMPVPPSVGALAPDHWTMADIARYEATGEVPEVDPELVALLERNGLEPRFPELSETVVSEAPLPSESEIPEFRTVRVEPEVVPEPVVVVEPEQPEMVDVFVRDDDDGPDPHCLVPYWLIPYADQLAEYGVRDFCVFKNWTPEEIGELLDELAGVPDEPEEQILIDEGPLAIPLVFTSSRVDKTLDEAEDEEEVNLFCGLM